MQSLSRDVLTYAGLAADAQRVLFAGRQLGDSSVLAQAGVADEDTLYILARLMGGAKKRKKKTYTKPKKQKHKHKKIKLRVLKFFKVSRQYDPGSSISRSLHHAKNLPVQLEWLHRSLSCISRAALLFNHMTPVLKCLAGFCYSSTKALILTTASHTRICWAVRLAAQAQRF